MLSWNLELGTATVRAVPGSGKTAGFLFPVLSALFRRGPIQLPPDAYAYGSRRRCYPDALILAPTRELACQIFDEARKVPRQRRSLGGRGNC